jgi:DNA-binding NarL/FixJ family response regulator
VIRVAVIDDHPMMRRGLETTLEGAGIEVVRSASSWADLRGAAPEADALVMDLYLGGGRPHLEDVGEASARYPVLVISASASPGDVSDAVAAGAQGYITKTASDAEVVAAVRDVASGRFHLSAELADALHDTARRRETSPLSPREEQALRLIAEGFTHRQAASRMGVTVATFDTYIKRIRQKLGLGNKAELTRTAMSLPPREHPEPV